MIAKECLKRILTLIYTRAVAETAKAPGKTRRGQREPRDSDADADLFE